MNPPDGEGRPDLNPPAPAESPAGAVTVLTPEEEARREHKRRWLGLVVIAIAQLTIVVDATIINVALPAMTADLNISEADRQWVLTGYTLAFGGFLLLGGRVADYLGLLRTFNIGLIGFGVASAVAGAAPNFQVLLVARAAQGLFGALMAPASLALLATTFKDPKERGKAFAIFGAVAGGGSAIGLLLGGILTEYASWRWTMFINIPITLFAVVGGMLLLKEFRPDHPGRLDLVGTVLGTGGMLTIVYGFSEAERHGWTQTKTLFLLFGGVSLLILFVLSQRMVANPVLPLRVLADRTRGGANLAVLLASVAMFGAFFWQTFFMQGVLGYSPVQTGVGFLAVTFGIIVSSAIVSSLVTKISPRLIMGVGLLLASAAALLMVRINLESTYMKDLLPAMLLGGLGMGAVFVPAFNAATIGVHPRDASIASASINTGQQVGGSLGVALISTIAANRTADWMVDKPTDPGTVLEGLVEGYVAASVWSAAILALAAVLVFALVNAKTLDISHTGEFGAPPVYDELEDPAPAVAASIAAPGPVPPLAPDAALTPAIPAPTAASESVPSYLSEPAPDRLPEPVSPVVSEPVHEQPAEPGAIPFVAASANGHGENGVPDDPHRIERPPAWAAAGGARPTFPRREEGPVANVQVHVCDATTNAPLGGAVLTLLDGVGRHLDRGWSGEDGNTGFPVAGPAEVVLVVRHRGYRPSASTVHVPHAGPTAEREVSLTVALHPAVVLHGTVRASGARRPIAGALVELTDETGTVLASTRTDERGGYQLADLTPGTRTLVVSPDNAAPVATQVELAPSGNVQHDVAISGRTGVAGVARDPQGAPLADAIVWLSDDAGHVVAQTRTDADGNYRLLDLTPGAYTLSAVGYPPATLEVDVADGADVEAVLTLRHMDAL
jgi:EmrB/QacA subfamily drug resistance transporter